MAIRDNLRKGLRGVAGLGREVVSSRAQALAEWTEQRQHDRIASEIDERLAKAAADAQRRGATGGHDIHDPARDPKSLAYNPYDVVAAVDHRERPSSMTYGAMEMIGRSVPVIADIVNVRTNQVKMFCAIPEDKYSPGFRVRHIDWRNTTPTRQQRARATELEEVLLHTGYHDPEVPDDSTPLGAFAQMFLHDSLHYDQGNFEIVPDAKGRPSYFTCVDASTVRLLDASQRPINDVYAVQVIDGAIITDFQRSELAFCIRNPRSSVLSHGYGISEIETLVKEITGFLYGMEYNRKAFTNGSTTKGILNFKGGTMPEKQLQAFRRHWYAQVAGVSNAWRTPITNAEDLQWINLQMSNRDMEYSAWMDFLIKIACARYLIAPEEVNFTYGNAGQAQAMGQAPIEEKLKASRDLGLRPLVRWFFDQLNRNFIQRIDPEYEAVAVGLDDKGREAEADLLEKQTRVFLTVDEARGRMELPAMGEDNGGNVILNATWLQFMQQKMMMEGGLDADDLPGSAPPGVPTPPTAKPDSEPTKPSAPADNGED